MGTKLVRNGERHGEERERNYHKYICQSGLLATHNRVEYSFRGGKS